MSTPLLGSRCYGIGGKVVVSKVSQVSNHIEGLMIIKFSVWIQGGSTGRHDGTRQVFVARLEKLQAQSSISY